ncbi:WD40-repeat-containing domain protein [Collybia nuda]|uniref:WD40-repeat-containing domain protein n=1 Tax=Collybia nuda TaxID=64659 RepID=A0A9P5Y6V6_9AGAR|nr:WD40-repeat-containing domain protein [Collybia nuda]
MAPQNHIRSASLSSVPTTNPRFSHLLNSVLGSPFLTTNDLEIGPDNDLDLVDGSPHAVPHTHTITRPSSPAPTSDFSIIDFDPADDNARYPYRYAYHGSVRGGFGYMHQRSASSATFGRRVLSASVSSPGTSRPGAPNVPFKSILPRIWDALSSPGRGFSPSPSPPTTPSPPSTRYNTFTKGKGVVFDYNPPPARYVDYSDLAPLDGEEGELIAIDDEACFIDIRAVTGIDILSLLPTEIALYILALLCTSDPRSCSTGAATFSTYYRYSSLPTTRASDQIRHSITSNFAIDQAQDVQDRLTTLLACRSVSKTWHALASDNTVWRALFLSRWDVDLRRANKDGRLQNPHHRLALSRQGSFNETYLTPAQTPILEPVPITSASASMRMRLAIKKKKKKLLTSSTTTSLFGSPSPSPANLSPSGVSSSSQSPAPPLSRTPAATISASPSQIYMPLPTLAHSRLLSPAPRRPTSVAIPVTQAPLRLDWRILYRERMELDKRWIGYGSLSDISRIPTNTATPNKTQETYEPKVLNLSGHTDSVYCLEFDSRRIITGSRDRTIKVWSLTTGVLLATFWGVHRGSVLCLKFEGDWDQDWADEELEGELASVRKITGQSVGVTRRNGGYPKRGFMVTGSSDCSVCVWDLYSGRQISGNDVGPAETSGNASIRSGIEEGVRHQFGGSAPDREVVGEVRAVLKGHKGGVLDLRIDKRWIVSCSKDAVIRIWDRNTLDLYQTLRGHEGPVNAVGLQGDRVVSASGDGKMILWDIDTGERVRTFEGHDRGLACIEFKDDLIVSGSNDCKIKLWSASTGECLRTLVGHEALVRALSFDPRSGRLVSASYDKTVKLWDLGSGKLIREFNNTHTSHIFDVKFDVARIVSTSHDQKITVLDFSHDIDTSLFI